MNPAFVADDGGGSHDHPPGHRGRFDESRWRVSHEELAVARMLVAEGHDVRSKPQRPAVGRTGDFEVCGRETEVKTLGPNATARSLANALIRAEGQGVDVIVDASKTRLHRLAADRGVAEFTQRRSPEIEGRRHRAAAAQIERIRVIGRGFDRSYRLGEGRQLVTSLAPETTLGLGVEFA